MAKLILETYRNPGPPLQKSYTSGSQRVDSSPDNTDQYHTVLKANKFKYNGNYSYKHKEHHGRAVILHDNGEWAHLDGAQTVNGKTPESLTRFLGTYVRPNVPGKDYNFE
jgi:hypothetical protein